LKQRPCVLEGRVVQGAILGIGAESG
jgi:hypothetical protein